MTGEEIVGELAAVGKEIQKHPLECSGNIAVDGGSSRVGTFEVEVAYCHSQGQICVENMLDCHKRESKLGLRSKKGRVTTHLDSDAASSTFEDLHWTGPDSKKRRLFSCLFPPSARLGLKFRRLTAKSV